MKFLVTGSAGLIGRQVCKDLSKAFTVLNEKPLTLETGLDNFVKEMNEKV